MLSTVARRWENFHLHLIGVVGVHLPRDYPPIPYDGSKNDTARTVTLGMGTVWEIDFYSRPILGDNGKKLWELLVCESPLTTQRSPDSLFRYAKSCPSNTVNSVWLREALEEAISKAPTPPTRIRFFRRQMNNMISKACKELGFDANLSRRTVALYNWLDHRMSQVYPQDPNYEESAARSPSVQYQPQTPQRLPDALLGQKWAFVTLEAGAFAEMPDWDIDFGEAYPLDLLDLDPETPIPGTIIFSSRATPLAGWMSGLELGFLKYNPGPPSQVLLETGGSDSWILANLNTPQLRAEAEGFEKTKQNAKGAHFLAVQSDPNSEAFAGFWLLQELNLL